jgi:ATP-dependent DNA helicase RecG
MLTPQNLLPFPKNPTIAQLFTQMGRSEELGTGIRNVFKYSKAYSGSDKVLFAEEDVFVTRVPLNTSIFDGTVNGIVNSNITDSGTVNGIVNSNITDSVTDNDIVNGIVNSSKNDLLNLISIEGGLSAVQLKFKIGKSLRSVHRYINQLRKDNLIEFRGAPKTGGYYLKTTS